MKVDTPIKFGKKEFAPFNYQMFYTLPRLKLIYYTLEQLKSCNVYPFPIPDFIMLPKEAFINHGVQLICTDRPLLGSIVKIKLPVFYPF